MCPAYTTVAILFFHLKCYHVCIQIEFIGDIMATMSIRGLDDKVLTRLKSQAEHEGSSLNALVLRLLQGTGASIQPSALKKFDDLNALAGTWSAKEALAFERNTAAFAEVDAALWK
jgi:plasmid stability protein